MAAISTEPYQSPMDAPAAPVHVDTQHEAMVHDTQLDFYGSKLATCSSDRTVKVFNISDNDYQLCATLQGHEGPVWGLSWAHPKFGVLLASCSFDGSVFIYKEQTPGNWAIWHDARSLHESSVNAVAFSPHEFGLQLACASADGRVSMLVHQPNHTWSVEYLEDCSTGVNAVSWAPYGAYYDPTNPDTPEAPRIVTAGCDNQIRFWKYNAEKNVWENTGTEAGHSDWVRDVAWAPCLLPGENMVASCSEDKTVLIWKQAEDGSWTSKLLNTFDDPVWKISWSVTGHLLAVSSGDSTVTLWKANLDGGWMQVESTLDDDTPQQS